MRKTIHPSMKFVLASTAGLIFGITLGIGPVQAQSVEDFYKGRTVEIYSGLSASGAYSAYARLLERHITKYIPGRPAAVFKVMEGASGRTHACKLAVQRCSPQRDRFRHHP